MKFSPGEVVVTAGVDALMNDNEEFRQHVMLSMRRHLEGDWGELCDEDRVLNEDALVYGNRLFSVYKKDGLGTIWIVTESDRSVTTVLKPDEY